MGVCSGFFFFVVLGDAGDAIVVDVTGDSGTAGFLGFGSGVDTGFFPDSGAGAVCFGGGEVVPVPPCFGEPLLFLVTSVQPSWLFVLDWT